MKTKLILHTARLFAAACFLTATSAIAGPGPQVMYAPVTSKHADIQPGTHLAVACGNCGAVISIPAEGKGYTRGFTCPSWQNEICAPRSRRPRHPRSFLRLRRQPGHSATLLRAM